MGKFIDMTGWVMAEHGVPESRLTVISQAEDKVTSGGNHSKMWNCQCSCGGMCCAYGQSLRRGTTLSCGCYNSEQAHKRFFQDLTGQRFGRLLVINRAEDYISPGGSTETRWNCLCDCGNHCVINGDNLKSGDTQSCGCLHIERIKQANKKHNTYKKMDNYYIGYYGNCDKEFYFDINDAEIVMQYYWYSDGNGYARTCVGRKFPSMHEILGCKEYDHINRNGSDNRRSNLRKCTRSQNQMNRKIQTNNTSGITGVWWNKTNQKWETCIYNNNKKIYIGSDTDKDVVIKMRLQAEADYYKEFAPQKHLFEQYGIVLQNECEVIK